MRKFLVIFLLLLPIYVIGQPDSGPGDPGGDPDDPIPITGIEWLIAAGGLFGAKKIYDNRRKTNK
ncbi:MAG: hypothetical protein ACNS60_10330 [Candidatus Cyclobacteriaceae bacterium M2_1C_046]